MDSKLLFKSNRWLIGLIVTASVLSGGIALYGISAVVTFTQKPAPEPLETTPPIQQVTALGRLEPEAEVISLSAPLDLDGDRITQLLVKEGDRVKAGQIIAVLDSHTRLQVALQQAQNQVRVAQAKLEQVKAGAKTGEILAQQAAIERLQAQLESDSAAQQETIARLEAQLTGDQSAQEATIRRLEAELRNAQAEYQRHQRLYREGAISNSEYDTKRLRVDTVKQQISEAQAILTRINTTTNKQIREAQVALNRIKTTGNKQIREAQATLNRIAEVRPVDVQAAQTEVDNAKIAVKRAQTELEQANIRAPIAGQILKIHTRVGEKMSENGIVDLAQNHQMVAVAEVYQSDIGKVKLGQQATVTGRAFTGKLRGTVFQIGLQVNRQNVFSNEPGENLDRRVVEVKIRLNPEDSKQVAGLTNLQVQTAIQL